MTAESEEANGGQNLIEFICECGDPTCRRTVVLTLDEYEQRRPDPILHPDHEPLPPSSSAASAELERRSF
jgi:hypothetical protein